MSATRSPDARSMAQKIAAIWAEVKRVPKSGKHPTQGYSFATESDVADLIRDLCAAQGVILLPRMVEHQVEQVAQTSKGNAIYRHTVDQVWTVTDGVEALELPWRGQADDSSDKGLAKALTSARKTFLISLFQVSSGDDPDARPEQDRAPALRSAPRSAPHAGNGPSDSPTRRGDPPTEAQIARAAGLRAALAGVVEGGADAVNSMVVDKAHETAERGPKYLNREEFQVIVEWLEEEATARLEGFDPDTGEIASAQSNGAPPVDAEERLISAAQRTRLHTIRGKAGVAEEAFRKIIAEHTGQESSSGIPKRLYDTIVAAVEQAADEAESAGDAAFPAEAQAPAGKAEDPQR